MKFFEVPITDLQKITDSCTIVTLDIGEKLKEQFQYTHGQHLTFRKMENGEEIRRSYSLCSSPQEKEWKIGVKKVEGGRFSAFINDEAKVGDTLEVAAPAGKFFVPLEPDKARNFVAFAAGSGITPIFSIIKTHLMMEPLSTFRLFFVNQSASSIIFREELAGLKNLFMSRFEVFHILTREHRTTPWLNGRLDGEKLETIYSEIIDLDVVADTFICGPQQMIFTVRDFLLGKGVDKKHIHFELFGTSGISAQKRPAKKASEGKTAEVVMHEGGKSYTFNMDMASETVLDAALRNSADLPYACKGGVCATCRAKLISGQVEMVQNYALEEEEVNNGYILTCQSFPQTDKIEVDFDA